MHISDIHIDELYKQGTDPVSQCHSVNTAKPSANVAGKYGTLASICDTPMALLNATFDWMAENTKDVDFILYTGDSARHDRDKKMPRQYPTVTYEHQLVVDKIRSVYDVKKVKFIPTFGNNDQFDYNKMANDSDPIIASLTSVWEPLGLGLSTNKQWAKGGYFAYELKEGLTVLNLNSMLLFASNVLTSDCAVPNSAGGAMLTWMESQLKELRFRGKKAYVMQHVPPTSQAGKSLYFPNCQSQYINLLGKYADTILASFYGHTNSDYLSFVYTNNTDKPRDGPFFLATITDTVPAVDFENSCVLHVNSQGPAIIPANNPAIRIYDYSTHHRTYGALTDYVQYWSDVVRANTIDQVEYDVEYRAARTYGLWNLSPFNWAEAFAGWATNNTAFQNYVRYRFVQNPTPALG
ncbi:Metallo-dependent phosphatase-like protein [Fimicolochytrium jonesii]|uniref:Metallo-dependent phosphatase-like protein n=1 Tax=Fimicolochytrium jonesii TaxID=1396493 RepID=UPI0022FE6F80|nr:Metallo-dependent phosphatase-like protein [Fimicolochytrium jonesii]KAI8824324.1 Metallo-dependent phosphatase-like protein [Fimicolochytrium jonesii]